MIGLAVTIGGTDYTSDVETIEIKWPASNELPSCEVVLSNVSGNKVNIPVFSAINITLPRTYGVFRFFAEKVKFGFSRERGHYYSVAGLAAPELLFLTEGNLDVVGTDLPVGQWNARGTTYTPYTSGFVPSLGSNLLDIGDLFTALLHTPQPGQT